jgi:membrane protein DedA with SNARE-associated domain
MDFLLHYSEAGILFALALIAFLDTLIGIGFFVFGEVAFLAAGATLATTGQWGGVIVVMLAAWLGDQTSFFLGRRLGARLIIRFLKPAKRRRAWRRAAAKLHRHGAGFIVLSRLFGPTAWVTPFLAGSAGFPADKFAFASAAGVLLGVGQFITIGALGALGLSNVQGIGAFVIAHWVAIVIFVTMAAVFLVIITQSKRHALARLILASFAAAFVFLSANLLYFFGTTSPASAGEPKPLTAKSACDLTGLPLLASAGPTNMHLPQPVNIALFSAKEPRALMADLGWIENTIFKRGDMGLLEFVQLIRQRTPPVSELYFQGRSADTAHQLPGTLAQRVHIRWWQVAKVEGGHLYFGAISRDEEIAVKYYEAIPAILHDIDHKVDLARDAFAKEVTHLTNYDSLGLAPLMPPTDELAAQDYVTDGGVLILKDAKTPLPPDQISCLGLTPPTRESQPI